MSDSWVRVAAASELVVGRGRYVEVDGFELAVFRLEGLDRVVVTRNTCPHAGGNLAAGTVEDGAVICPWHAWGFDLSTGRCVDAEEICLERFECEVRDGEVFVRLAGSVETPKAENAKTPK